LTEFDIGLVVTRPLTLNDRLALPNKLFEYLMAGLAVVVPDMPGVGAIVAENAVGVTFEAGSPSALARVLTELAAAPTEVAAYKERARQVALERFSAEAQRPALERAWGVSV
jgi:glycosyltransferase involved in cell wall biosynthesis